jgi:hypothetical protein
MSCLKKRPGVDQIRSSTGYAIFDTIAQEIADETMRTARAGSSTMADEIPHPHDSMVRAVLGDVAEAGSFLQRYVPEALSQTLNWSTLRLLEGSFVDEFYAAVKQTFSTK